MRILLIRLSSFGDVVFTLPLAQALHEWQPSAEIAWVTEKPFAGLLEGAPCLSRLFFASTRAWRKAPLAPQTRGEMVELRAGLRDFAPDLVVDAHGLLKAAWISLLLPSARIVGFGPRTAGERAASLFYKEKVEAPERPHLIDRALALAEHLAGRSGWSRFPDTRHLSERPDATVDSWLAKREGRPFALFVPFSSARAKEWPAASQTAVARSLFERGLESYVKWGPVERERAEGIEAASGGRIGLAPEAGAAATARLASRAALVIGVDTGPTHLAAASGAPTLALFGPTDPARYAPSGPRARVLKGDSSRPESVPQTPGPILEAAIALLGEKGPDAP